MDRIDDESGIAHQGGEQGWNATFRQMVVPGRHHPRHAPGVVAEPNPAVEMEIADHQPATRAQRPGDLPQRACDVGQILEDLQGHRPVGGAVSHRDALRPSLDEADMGAVCTASAGGIQHVPTDVDPSDRALFAHGAGQFPTKQAVAAADVQNVVAGLGTQRVETRPAPAHDIRALISLFQDATGAASNTSIAVHLDDERLPRPGTRNDRLLKLASLVRQPTLIVKELLDEDMLERNRAQRPLFAVSPTQTLLAAV